MADSHRRRRRAPERSRRPRSWGVEDFLLAEFLRRQPVTGELGDDEDEDTSEPLCNADRRSPLAVVEAVLAHLEVRLCEAVLGLPEDQRTALVLRETVGLSYVDIARVLGCADGTVMSRLSHARRGVRASLSAWVGAPMQLGRPVAECRGWRERLCRSSGRLQSDPAPEENESDAGSDGTALSESEASEVRDAVQMLERTEQAIILMALVDRLSLDEISYVMEEPRETIAVKRCIGEMKVWLRLQRPH